MGMTRLPKHVLEMRGSFKKHAGRRENRKLEPQVAKAFPLSAGPPDSLNEAEKKTWLEIVDHAPPGVLTWADPQIVEMGARLLVAERARTITSPERGHLIKILGLLGMTPADRVRVQISVPVEEPTSKYAKIS